VGGSYNASLWADELSAAEGKLGVGGVTQRSAIFTLTHCISYFWFKILY